MASKSPCTPIPVSCPKQVTRVGSIPLDSVTPHHQGLSSLSFLESSTPQCLPWPPLSLPLAQSCSLSDMHLLPIISSAGRANFPECSIIIGGEAFSWLPYHTPVSTLASSLSTLTHPNFSSVYPTLPNAPELVLKLVCSSHA